MKTKFNLRDTPNRLKSDKRFFDSMMGREPMGKVRQNVEQFIY